MLNQPNQAELSFVELVVLVDVEGRRIFALARARRDRSRRRAPEEAHFDVFRKAMDAEGPALALDSIKP
jgi:hypothetical protein